MSGSTDLAKVAYHVLGDAAPETDFQHGLRRFAPLLEEKMKQVFPDRAFEELKLDHPLYHCVFEIPSKGQVPNVRQGMESQYTGVTWEPNHEGDTRTVHHRGITDDKGRLMVLATHNTDNGDGWEREGEDTYFFHHFSEKISYPLGINIVFYVMTH